MSFGFSIGDFVLLAQLAKNTVQNARRACGARDELVREAESLHIVLRRVKAEVSKPTSIINRTEENGTDDNRRAELNSLARHCTDVLRVLSTILEKYNALSEQERSVTKLWKQVKFGNGEMKDLANIRSELATHTQAFNMFLNLLSIGSQGKVEEYMDSQGRDLREIKQSLNWVTATLQSSSHDENSKSILTTYTEDDKGTWKNFRRELIKEGFSHRTLRKHRRIIQEYLMELGQRGVLDDPVLTDREDDNSSGTLSSSDDETPCASSTAESFRNSSGLNLLVLENNNLTLKIDFRFKP